MAEIKWIKITTDIFDDEKMKIIDTMPDRDALIVIWFKLLALTGKKNESGLLFLSPKMPYTEEMLATIFNRPINTVRLAITMFENFGMIEVMDNDVISIINWEKHQNVDGMEKVKSQNLLRQRKNEIKRKLVAIGYKQKDAEEIAEKEKHDLPSNVISRYTNGTDKIRLDKKRKDKIDILEIELVEDKEESKQSVGHFLKHLLKHFNKIQLSVTMMDNVKRWCKELELNPMEEIEHSSYLQGHLDMKPTLNMFNKKDTYIKMKNGEYRNREIKNSSKPKRKYL